jgi:alpha-tubulin suppressor-like RCC1 family protein
MRFKHNQLGKLLSASGARVLGRMLFNCHLGISVCLLAAMALTAARAARADAVYTWGSNGSYQLGGDTGNPAGLVKLYSLSKGVTAIAAGGQHSLAVQDGGLFAWGRGAEGELGIGQQVRQLSTPVAVNGLSSGATAIAGGATHSLAVVNGSVFAWGANLHGQLGDGTNTWRFAPLPVVGLSSGVTAIAGGNSHSLAIKDGGVYAWGDNVSGELGDGTRIQRTSPVAVTGLSEGVTAIAAGNLHSLALQNGGVYGWGLNYDGELGDGTKTSRLVPIAVPLLTSSVTSIAGGDMHSLAVKNGNVYAWGDNVHGQLGDGTRTARYTPELIDPTDLHDIIAVAASFASSYALSSDGTVWDWGENGVYQLGLGNGKSWYQTPQRRLPPSGYVFTSIDASAAGSHVVATLTAVPEPSACSLIALVAGAILARRRRYRA